MNPLSVGARRHVAAGPAREQPVAVEGVEVDDAVADAGRRRRPSPSPAHAVGKVGGSIHVVSHSARASPSSCVEVLLDVPDVELLELAVIQVAQRRWCRPAANAFGQPGHVGPQRVQGASGASRCSAHRRWRPSSMAAMRPSSVFTRPKDGSSIRRRRRRRSACQYPPISARWAHTLPSSHVVGPAGPRSGRRGPWRRGGEALLRGVDPIDVALDERRPPHRGSSQRRSRSSVRAPARARPGSGRSPRRFRS